MSGPGALDLRRFEGCAAGSGPMEAGARVRPPTPSTGAALWRGDALADLAYESFAQAPIARLEELRLAAVEARIEAELALGRDAAWCRSCASSPARTRCASGCASC